MKSASFNLFNSSLPTKVTLTSDTFANQSNPDQGVVFTARVGLNPANPYAPVPNPYGAVPQGSVKFSVSNWPGTDVTVPLDASGTAVSPPYPNLSIGLHQVTATYLGDPQKIYELSSVNLAQASGMSYALVALSSSQPAALYGTPLTFTAGVKPPPGVTPIPTGNVQFAVDGVALGGPVTVDAQGMATSPATSGLNVGLHTVGVTYLGDAGFVSSYQTLAQTVQATASVTLTTTTNPTTITAQVTSSTSGVSMTPGGKVTFTNTSDPVVPLLVTVQLDSTGKATTPPLTLCCPVNKIVATYNGSVEFKPSSATVDLTVTPPQGIARWQRPPYAPPPCRTLGWGPAGGRTPSGWAASTPTARRHPACSRSTPGAS